MDKKQLLAELSIVSFALILFMPQDSKAWLYLLFLGIVFGIWWMKN